MNAMEPRDYHDEIWDAPVINARNKTVPVFERILDDLVENIEEDDDYVNAQDRDIHFHAYRIS